MFELGRDGDMGGEGNPTSTSVLCVPACMPCMPYVTVAVAASNCYIRCTVTM